MIHAAAMCCRILDPLEFPSSISQNLTDVAVFAPKLNTSHPSIALSTKPHTCALLHDRQALLDTRMKEIYSMGCEVSEFKTRSLQNS